MEKKQCSKCARLLPRSQFWPRQSSSDGLVGQCRSCSAVTSRKSHERNKEQRREYSKRYRQAHRAELAQATYQHWATPRGKANRTLARAVEHGKLAKPTTCSECGDETSPRELHGHHADYEKPYDVEWLCRLCHMRRHRKYA